ncbi:calcium-binding protein [Roseivivax marinus]|uniref:calcium-binding protein n=1 Tax=Roseivivax marinus TaxID=1379903 RepID=UPI00273D6640|nr:calcium-binding protein [Roseivivax marinus]
MPQISLSGIRTYYESSYSTDGSDFYFEARRVAVTLEVSDDHALLLDDDGLRTVSGSLGEIETSVVRGNNAELQAVRPDYFTEVSTNLSLDRFVSYKVVDFALRRMVVDGVPRDVLVRNDVSVAGSLIDSVTTVDYLVLAGPPLPDLNYSDIEYPELGGRVDYVPIQSGPLLGGGPFSLLTAAQGGYPYPDLPDIAPIVGTEGPDNLAGAATWDTIEGGSGDDALWGLRGGDMIVGGEGDDSIGGGEGRDSVVAGPGNDSVGGGPGRDTLSGGDGNDRLFGGRHPDLLFGGAGDDITSGGAGSDDLLGDEGDDTLAGGFGADIINGGVGRDLLGGGFGADEMFGGTDNDTIYAGHGDDTLNAGPGADSLSGGPGDDWLTSAPNFYGNYDSDGGDTLYGGSGHDILDGHTDGDELRGGPGRDTLNGAAGDDILLGSFGADNLRGGPGNDILLGGGNRDHLNGGSGDDIITGGDGSDTFIFSVSSQAAFGSDVLTDFTPGIDLIEFRIAQRSEVTLSASEDGDALLLFERDALVGQIELNGIAETSVTLEEIAIFI